MMQKVLIGVGFVAVFAVGYFVGGRSSLMDITTAPQLQGDEKIITNTLSLNRLLNEVPQSNFFFGDGSGVAIPDPLGAVLWARHDVPLEDTPTDFMMALEFDKLPFAVERSQQQICAFQDQVGFQPVCFYPPKGIPYAVWPVDWPIGKWFFHPAIPANNPEHPGSGHPDLLLLIKNVKGPTTYPSDYEQKYPGLKLRP